MTVYLVRHGEAVAETEDVARPLNQRGRDEVAATARVAGMVVAVERIIHSGKLRAQQTAEIWGAALERNRQIEEYADLEPMADPQHAAAFIDRAREPLMLVGHLPHLGRLLAALVVGDADRDLINCPTGGVVALAREARGWRIEWLLTPKLARAITRSS